MAHHADTAPLGIGRTARARGRPGRIHGACVRGDLQDRGAVEPGRHPHLSDARHVRRHALSDRAGARDRLCRRPGGAGRLAARLSARRAAPPAREAPTFMIPASNLLAYVIGPIVLLQPPWVAVALAVAAVLLLGTRERLHRLIHVVPRDELLTVGEFLILVGIILPLVPHERVSSLTPLTPYGIWLAVVTVCTLSYLSYLLQRYAPIKNAALLPAVLGGAYSSTATTVVLAKRLREAKQAPADISAGIVAATAIMYVRIGVVVALFDMHIALTLAPALVVLAAIGAALAIYEWRRPRARSAKTNLVVLPKNPLEIPAALIFAALIVVISVISAWVRGAFGESGILVLSAVVGATDIDPFVLNIAQGGIGGMSVASLCAAVLIAAASNNVAKAAYAIGFGGMAGRRPAVMLLALAVLGVLAASIYIVKP